MLFAIFIFIAACVTTIPPALERLTPYQPMRGFHLVYLFFALFSGGVLGEFVLRRIVFRWLVLFVPVSLAMFYAQRRLYPASRHIDLPAATPPNPCLHSYACGPPTPPLDPDFA